MSKLSKLVFAVYLLFLQACVSYDNLSASGRLYKGMSKQALEEAVVFANQFQHPFGRSATREYHADRQIEIIGVATNSQAFIFTGVTKPSDPPLICTDIFDCDLNVGNGRLDSWHPTLEAAKKYANSKFNLVSRISDDRHIVTASQNKTLRSSTSAKPSSTDRDTKASTPLTARPALVTEMWEDLQRNQKTETLFDISARCETLTQTLETEDGLFLSEWNIDTEVVRSWIWEMNLAKWPKSLWGSPPKPPRELVEIGAKSYKAHVDYSVYLIRIDERNNNNTRFAEYLDLQVLELKLCEQIAKSF